MFGAFGSTPIRSPLLRPSALPSKLNGKFKEKKFAPWLVETRMTPAVLRPAAMYTRLLSVGSIAMLSIPCRLLFVAKSSKGIHELLAEFQRYAPPMSVRQ